MKVTHTLHAPRRAKGQASPVPTGRPSSPLSSLSEDQAPGRGRVARPTPGPTDPRRPSGALGQLGPAPLRFGPLAAHGDERAGLRGRPLSVASCNQGPWKGATAA